MKVCFISLINDDAKTKAERIADVTRLLYENAGSDIYLLPEMWNTGFFSSEIYEENAEHLDGETVTALSSAAAELGAYIFGGSIIERVRGKLYNTAVLLDRRGNLCGKYSKIHLFGDEKSRISAGGEICVCDTEFGKAGISICYDLRFPEQYRKMTKMGAEIFLTCAAWPKSRAEHWALLNHARAVENQALVLAACSSGTDCGNVYAGASYAVSSYGETLLKTSSEAEHIDITIDEIKKYREDFPVLKDAVKFGG